MCKYQQVYLTIPYICVYMYVCMYELIIIDKRHIYFRQQMRKNKTHILTFLFIFFVSFQQMILASSCVNINIYNIKKPCKNNFFYPFFSL